MSDPHDREPVDQATIDCWRTNYGLDKRTPAKAAKWWGDNLRGLAPSGCVAALGVALDELDALRKDAARLEWLLDSALVIHMRSGEPSLATQDREGIDAAMGAD